MRDPQPRHTAQRKFRQDLIITMICAVLLVGGGAYLIFRPGGSTARETPAPVATSSSAPGTVSPSSAPPGHVSGVPMPIGDLPGWRQTFADDFTGPLTDRWATYDGQPDGDPGGWFDSDQVRVNRGELLIVGSRKQTPNGRIYATGGMTNSKVLSQVYGRFEVRFRMDKGRGIQFNLLLWPTDDSWPPEINFAEDNGKERTGFSANLHYGPPHRWINRHLKIDTSQWHTVGVEWTPGELSYLVDGKVWATMKTGHVPKVPMSLAIQTQAWHCGTQWAGCPNSSTPPEVNLHVDWVVGYEMA